MIAAHQRLKEHSRFLFIPGPDDIGDFSTCFQVFLICLSLYHASQETIFDFQDLQMFCPGAHCQNTWLRSFKVTFQMQYSWVILAGFSLNFLRKIIEVQVQHSGEHTISFFCTSFLTLNCGGYFILWSLGGTWLVQLLSLWPATFVIGGCYCSNAVFCHYVSWSYFFWTEIKHFILIPGSNFIPKKLCFFVKICFIGCEDRVWCLPQLKKQVILLSMWISESLLLHLLQCELAGIVLDTLADHFLFCSLLPL